GDPRGANKPRRGGGENTGAPIPVIKKKTLPRHRRSSLLSNPYSRGSGIRRAAVKGGPEIPVDSRNENLPEKCIHQNCASRPGGSCCRFFCCAHASAGDAAFGWGAGRGRHGVSDPRRSALGPLVPGNR